MIANDLTAWLSDYEAMESRLLEYAARAERAESEMTRANNDRAALIAERHRLERENRALKAQLERRAA